MTTSADIFLENVALASVSTTTTPSGNAHSTRQTVLLLDSTLDSVLELDGSAFETFKLLFPGPDCGGTDSDSDSDDGVTTSSTSCASAMVACSANAGIATVTTTSSSDTSTEYSHMHGSLASASACGRASSATGGGAGGSASGDAGGGMRGGVGRSGGVGTDVGTGVSTDVGGTDEAADGTRRTAAHSSWRPARKLLDASAPTLTRRRTNASSK